MKITVIGTGYVGLVVGTCFSEMGNEVFCVDNDETKINLLKQAHVPFYEPGLEELIRSNVDAKRLFFTKEISKGIKNSQLCFIAVGTPPNTDGSANLMNVLSVAKEIGIHLKNDCVIAIKSTVPVGSAEKVRDTIKAELINQNIDISFDVVSNPEFLKEGNSIKDFMKPDRIIVGCQSAHAENVMRMLYKPFTQNHDLLQFMGVKEAEMTKYASNAMLATKISFMNELSNLCDLLKVDIEDVRKGMGSDSRIGYSFIYPGCGYGGSCFPKDVQALIAMASATGFSSDLLKAVESRNTNQKRYLFEKIKKRFPDLSKRKFAIWGLSFKPETDDMREAPSKILIEQLITSGSSVNAYDPVAIKSANRELPLEWLQNKKVCFTDTHYSALEGVDALVLVTEWKMFRVIDLDRISQLMKSKIIFDGRNQYDPKVLQEAGFEYYGIGRSNKEIL